LRHCIETLEVLFAPEIAPDGCQVYVKPAAVAVLRVIVFVKQTDGLLAVINGLITGNTLTVATAFAVHVPAPANTE
jgi:hypothetical protein